MSISGHLRKMISDLQDSYEKVEEKGGTIPEHKNTNNLPPAIESISGGGGGHDPTDPHAVYEALRPADWMVMPEIGENEDNVLYFLLMIAKDRTESITIQAGYAGYKREFGSTDENGVFTPIESLTTTSNISTLPMSAFSRPDSIGKKQLIMKVTPSGSGNITEFSAYAYDAPSVAFRRLIHEFKGKASRLTKLNVFGSDYPVSGAESLRFFTLVGENSVTRCDNYDGIRFKYCRSLEAVVELDLSKVTFTQSLFQYCSSLIAVPRLNTSLVTSFSGMFSGCTSLEQCPALDTSNGTVFSGMFEDCSGLSSISGLDTSKGQNFSSFMKSAFSLASLPDIDISSATNIEAMFSYCHGLEHVDLTGYDFSSMGSSGWGSFLYQIPGQLTVELGDTFGPNGIQATGTFISSYSYLANSSYPLRIKINKTDAVLPIAANATTVFSSASYVLIYVPDALYADYQADAKWATLGTRLKRFSELPA